MEFTCLKSQLQKSFQLAEKYTSKNASLSTLSGVLVQAGKNKLTIRSTDLNTCFETSISAQVKKEGSIVIPPRPSISLLSSVGEEKVKGEVKDNNLYFITSKTITALKTYPADDFPKLPKIKGGQKFVLKSDELLSNLKSVSFAAAFSEIKPEIASIFLKNDSGKILKVVATDSFRLAEKSFKEEIEKPFSFLFPAQAAAEFIKLIENFEGEIAFSLEENQLFAAHPLFSFFTRLTEGKFPDYEQIIPSAFSTEVAVNRRELVENLKLSGIFAGRLREARIHIYPGDNLLEILTSDSELGEHTSRLSAQVTGENLQISFNQRYLLEGLEPISSESVILRFSGQSRPLVIQSPQDASYIYLVMPMKNA